MVVKRKKPIVFLVHKFETSNGKHRVSFGRNLNLRKNNRSFRKISDAKKFAINKAKKIGANEVIMDLPRGNRTIKIK